MKCVSHAVQSAWVFLCPNSGRGDCAVSKIIGVTPHENYTLTLSFDDGSELKFNMQNKVETIQFHKLKENELFAKVRFSDKSIFWAEEEPSARETCPLRLTLDNILFSLRDLQ